MSITILRGDTLSLAITGLGNISSRAKLWFTVKVSKTDADAAAIIQIEETAGLVYLNGAAAGVSGNGSITVDDEVAGDITIALAAAETAKLIARSTLSYDVQMRTAAGSVETLETDTAIVTPDVTRATS